ncbi:MAG TPA: hypothetical protein VKB09_08260 [Thermomicrobiales bacterium]|nr:hypothetical protein [Thermomicrobiales bacterium]
MLHAELQRAVSCVTRAVLVRGYGDEQTSDFLAFPGRFVTVAGESRLGLSVHHTFDVRAKTTGYFYQIRDQREREVIAFHWHPGRRDQPAFPHLHIDGASGPVAIVRKNHGPTGRVSLESVVRFLIAELQVRPLRHDWERVLEEGERGFMSRRSW